MAWYHRFMPNFRSPPAPAREIDLRWVQRADASDIFAARYMDAGYGSKAWANPALAEYYAKSTAVYSAVKLRADSVASAPLVVMTETSEGLEPVGPQHPVQEVFDRVNPWWTRADLMRATETHLSLFGSAFWFVDRDGEAGTEIWPIRADRVRIIPERKTRGVNAEMPNAYIAGYMFEVGGRQVPLMTDEVMWFRYFNPMDEYAGLSPVAPGRLTFDMGMDAVRFNRNFFSEGTNPGNLAFSTDKAYTNDQVDEFYMHLEKRFKGSGNSHRPFLLHNGLKAENLGMTQRDMEYMASLQYTVEDAARVFRVWPELLASGTRAAFRNVGEAVDDFWLSTISSEWEFIESEITELLVPILGGQAQGLSVAFDTAEVPALQRARDRETRQDLDAVAKGAMTINEWREGRGLDPVDWGDVAWMSTSVHPVSSPDMPDVSAEPMPDDGPPEPVPPELTEAMPKLETRKALPPASKRGTFKRTAQEKLLRSEYIKELWIKTLTRRERTFRSMMNGLFRDQQEEVERYIRRTGIETVDGLADLIDIEAAVNKWTQRAEPLYEDAVVGGARATASTWGLKPLQPRLEQQRVFNPLNPEDPGFKLWLTQRMRWWAQRTNETTAKLLRSEIESAIQAGDTLPSIMGRVEKVFDFSSAVRSERIARTEMVAAQNRGNLEIMSASGVVQQKRWLSVVDARTRESHISANGQVVRVDEQFHIGEDMMDAPGQGSLGGENVNCRCTVIPVVD